VACVCGTRIRDAPCGIFPALAPVPAVRTLPGGRLEHAIYFFFTWSQHHSTSHPATACDVVVQLRCANEVVVYLSCIT